MLCRCQLLSIALLLVAHTKMLERMDRIQTKERFLLFSQRCLLRNTADLLFFLLHSVLSVTSVKIVCCHIAITHTLRDELICGSFQLSIWQLTLQHALSFNSLLPIKLVITLTEDIINQSEPEKQDKNQISKKKFWNLSDFELEFSKRVGFLFEVFTTRQVLMYGLASISQVFLLG